jgi:hypothetical protein
MPGSLEFQQKMRCSKSPHVIQPSAEGYLLAENAQPHSRKSSNLLGWIIGGFFLIVFSWFLLPLALIVLVFAIIYRPARQYLRAFFLLQPGELIFSQYPLRLGSSERVTFRRKLKGNRKFPKNGSVDIKLLCVERVNYTKGTDTITDIAVIEERELRSQAVISNVSELRCHFDLDLPDRLPPSFEAAKNQIRWIISVGQNMPGIAENIESNFTLLVEV